MIDIYLKGLFIGLAYVAPIGVQNIFIINASLRKSRRQAFFTAFVIAFFDISLSLFCFFGIGSLITTFPILEKIMLILGGLIVCYIGLLVFRGNPSDDKLEGEGKSERNIVLDAFAVTFLNPQAVIDGTMLFGGNVSSLLISERRLFIIGSASASIIWFFSIALILPFFKKKITGKVLIIINKICGLYLVFNGLSLLFKFFKIMIA